LKRFSGRLNQGLIAKDRNQTIDYLKDMKKLCGSTGAGGAIICTGE
jgi:hypothetical protein